MGKYGEPWYAIGPLTEEECLRAGGTPPEIGEMTEQEDDNGPASVDGFAVFDDEKRRDRAIACVNACSSMPDPEGAVKQLTELARLVADEDYMTAVSEHWDLIKMARAALTALGEEVQGG